MTSDERIAIVASQMRMLAETLIEDGDREQIYRLSILMLADFAGSVYLGMLALRLGALQNDVTLIEQKRVVAAILAGGGQ